MNSVGAVLIVQNEEVLLARCLASLQGIDEIIICDQGSKDRTIEVAKCFTDKVFTDHKWNDSFCDARNEAKSHSTTDWILSIDADEVLHDLGAVREAVAVGRQRKEAAIDVEMIASDNGQLFYFPRLFRNDPRVFWLGNIHNHLSVNPARIGNVRITHGYSPAHELDPDRSFRILKKEVETRPDAVREMFYLGREYFYRRDYENAVILLGKYVQLSRYLPEKAEAFLIMSKSYWEMRDADSAKDAIVQALICNANFKEAILWMALLAGKGTGHPRWEANAKQWEKMAETATNDEVLFVRNI